MALQEAAEAYLVSLFEDTNLAAIHAKRQSYFLSLFYSPFNLRHQVLPSSPRISRSLVVSEANVHRHFDVSCTLLCTIEPHLYFISVFLQNILQTMQSYQSMPYASLFSR